MPPNIPDLEVVFENLLSIMLVSTGFSSFVMLLIGGIRLMLAGSDKEATQKAHQLITYAIFGVGIGISSWVIINLLGSFLGLDLSRFTICFPTFARDPSVGAGCI